VRVGGGGRGSRGIRRGLRRGFGQNEARRRLRQLLVRLDRLRSVRRRWSGLRLPGPRRAHLADRDRQPAVPGARGETGGRPCAPRGARAAPRARGRPAAVRGAGAPALPRRQDRPSARRQAVRRPGAQARALRRSQALRGARPSLQAHPPLPQDHRDQVLAQVVLVIDEPAPSFYPHSVYSQPLYNKHVTYLSKKR